MNWSQRIYFLLLEIILAFLAINLVQSFELKKDIIKSKEIKIKLRSLDTTDDDEDDDESEAGDEDESSNETPLDSSTIYNSTIPSSSVRNNTSFAPAVRKTSSGLSTGAICGIAIPCVAALLGVAAAAAFIKGGAIAGSTAGALGSTSPSLPGNLIETSLDKFKVIEDIPMTQQVPQPQIGQQPQIIQQPQIVQQPQII